MNDFTISIDPNTIYPDWVYKYGLKYSYGLCQCGCGQTTNKSKYNDNYNHLRTGEHHQFVTRHNFRQAKDRKPEDIFWSLIIKGVNDDCCWNWIGTKTKGYGVFTCLGISYIAHRFSYQIHYGEFDDSKVIMHLCDNPACVNPKHLAVGTQAENIQDMVAKNRQSRGETNGHAKLTDQTVREIRILLASKVSQNVIASKYHIDQAQISNIARGKSWKHVT